MRAYFRSFRPIYSIYGIEPLAWWSVSFAWAASVVFARIPGAQKFGVWNVFCTLGYFGQVNMIMIDMYLYIYPYVTGDTHICSCNQLGRFHRYIRITWKWQHACMSCSLTSCSGLPTAFGKAGSITEARHLSILCHCHCLSEPDKLNHVRRCSKQCDSVWSESEPWQMLERRLRNKSNYPHNILWVPSVWSVCILIQLLGFTSEKR